MASANELFVRYLEEAIGPGKAKVALSAMEEPASVSVRLNPYKPVKVRPFGAGASTVPWSSSGLMLDGRPAFTLDPLFHAGCYYVQDSSSMFVGHVLRQVIKDMPKDRIARVLDLCAAPGGKTTDAAASLRAVFGDGFLLVSNEVIRQRATVLSGNVALWGDPSVVVSSSDPAVVGALEGYFDVVLADVPCSGEGMFRKDADAVAQWSAENVEHCAARQRRILADVWPALAENGILVYSTCTFNRYENDINVRWAADNLGADIVDIGSLAGGALPDGVMATECGCSLVPGFVRGEGQFCAVLRKRGGMERVADIRAAGGRQPDAGVPSVFSGRMSAAVRGDLVKAVPEAVSGEIAFLESRIRLISSGCAAFMRRGKDLVPCADLALDIKLLEDAFPRVEVDRDLALKYLHRDTFALPGVEKGYVLICFEGHPLGFVKNLGGRCNNLHPQERRIRMDIG